MWRAIFSHTPDEAKSGGLAKACCSEEKLFSFREIEFLKKVSAEGISLNDNQVIQDLDQGETCKYLGMEEGEGVQHHKMKVNIRKEYKRRIKLVFKSELNARNKIAAINTLAVPVILYSYGVIDWKLDEIQTLTE